MEKINKFKSIRLIKTVGVITSVVFLLSVIYNVINIVMGYGSIYSIILPTIFFIMGIYMFIKPYKKGFFIYLSIFILYFFINIGLIIMIAGYEYVSQIVFEAIWLVYFAYVYVKIKDIKVDEDDVKEYDQSIDAFNKNDLFYMSVTNLLYTTRWICTIYENYILVKHKFSFSKMLIDRSTFKFDFGNVNSNILLGYVYYNNKKRMCRMRKQEYEAYKKLMKKRYK